MNMDLKDRFHQEFLHNHQHHQYPYQYRMDLFRISVLNHLIINHYRHRCRANRMRNQNHYQKEGIYQGLMDQPYLLFQFLLNLQFLQDHDIHRNHYQSKDLHFQHQIH